MMAQRDQFLGHAKLRYSAKSANIDFTPKAGYLKFYFIYLILRHLWL